MVRELGRRRSPTADAVTAGTRSSATTYPRLSVIVIDQGRRRRRHRRRMPQAYAAAVSVTFSCC